MRTVKIIAIGLTGLILGIGLGRFLSDGYSQKWERLSAPPQEVTELIPTGDPPLFIKTLDGNTYLYSDWQNEGWTQKSVPQDLINPFEVIKPCDFSFPEFSRFSNAPQSISDCLQEKTMYADGYINYAFVIDNKGNIWEWQHATTPEDITPMLCFPSFGLLFGLSLGYGLTSMNNFKEKS